MALDGPQRHRKQRKLRMNGVVIQYDRWIITFCLFDTSLYIYICVKHSGMANIKLATSYGTLWFINIL